MAILKDLLVQGTSRFFANVTGTNIIADSFVKSGGTSSQFLKADGSVDSNTYAISSSLDSYLPIAGGTLTGSLTAPSFIKSGGTSGQFLKADGSVDSNTYSLSDHEHTKIKYVDSRSTAVTPTDAVAINGVQLDFKNSDIGGLGGTYNGVLTLDPYSDSSGGYPIQLGWNTALDADNTRSICIRTAKTATEWNSWRVIADQELTTAEIDNICV